MQVHDEKKSTNDYLLNVFPKNRFQILQGSLQKEIKKSIIIYEEKSKTAHTI